MATTIQDLEERVDTLYNSVLQMQANLNPVIDETDKTANKVVTNSGDIEVNSANIDYIAMMSDIDIPTED